MRKPVIEQDSATWCAVVAWAESRLADLRKKNDGNLEAIPTAHLRGQIATLKTILALPTAAPIEPGDD